MLKQENSKWSFLKFDHAIMFSLDLEALSPHCPLEALSPHCPLEAFSPHCLLLIQA